MPRLDAWKGPLEIGWAIASPGAGGPPKHIVEDIRRFWKPYVPLLCTRLFEGPDLQKQAFRYHVVGMWRPNPDADVPDFGRIVKGLDRPSDFPFDGGVVYEQHTIAAPWPDRSWQRGRATPDIPLSHPDAPLPGAWQACERITEPPLKMEWERIAHWIQQCIHFTQLTAGSFSSKLAEYDAAVAKAEADGQAKIDADADYRFKQWRGVFNRAVSEGRFLPLPRIHQPQEYAFHGRHGVLRG